MGNDFVKVYDLSDLSFFDVYKNHFYIIIPLIFFFAVVIYLFKDYKKTETLNIEQIQVRIQRFDLKLVFVAILSFVIFVSTNIVLLIDYVELSNVFKDNKCSYVEGAVFNYVPLIKETKGDEEFQIGNEIFRYSDGDLTAGYHKTHANGGIIRSGAYLKIWYIKTGLVKIGRKYPLMIKILRKM